MAKRKKPASEPEKPPLPSWGYDPEKPLSPNLWSTVYPAGLGIRQSPIDIELSLADRTNGSSLAFNYNEVTFSKPKHHDRHVGIDVTEGGTITLSKRTYELKDIHFHVPAEHTLEEQRYPMEVHFIHDSYWDNKKSEPEPWDTVVTAVLVDVGASRSPFVTDFLRPLANVLTPKAGEEWTIDPTNGYPAKNRSFFRYQGSLTTPPCTEGITFLVFAEPVSAPLSLIQKFRQDHANNRPIQPRNDRTITYHQKDITTTDPRS